MAEKNWGNCKNCRFFSSRNSNPDESEVARCNQPQLSQFALLVSGASGCNRYEARVGLGVEEQAPAVH